MKPLKNQLPLPFVTWLLLIVTTAAAQTPAPALHTRFQLPLTDSTTATAALLPTHDGQAWLVYATNNGNLGTYYLTPTELPGPDPPQPIPQKLAIAIVENPATTTLQQRDVLSAIEWRKLATEKHNFLGIVPTDIKEAKTGLPPPALVPFLDRAKNHNLPWIILSNQTGTILWEGQLPPTSQQLTAIIQRYGG
jgi:hypothetical protein